MSDISPIQQKNDYFTSLHNKSYRLAAAVFAISNIMDQEEELRTKVRNLSLELVSLTVSLKDINFSDARKLLSEIERKALELMSMLDIASIAGLISKMNGSILREEFQNFLSELQKFSERFEENRNVSIGNILTERALSAPTSRALSSTQDYQKPEPVSGFVGVNVPKSENGNGNGSKRKDTRKNTILEFIKRHNNVSIKDIAPHVVGCSEKTIQRELINLINEGKIKKMGERRWSRYSVI